MASYYHEEKAALLGGGRPASLTYGRFETLEGEIEVKPLRYSDIPRAVRCTYAATRVESVSRYFDDADRGPLKLPQMLFVTLSFVDNVRLGRAVTINHGDSVLSYREPGDARAGPLLSWVLKLPFFDRVKSSELRKREIEVGTKLRAMIKSALGDRVSEMMELSGLATAPAKQGRGYATALVKYLNDMADARGRAVWVFTDDAKWFYEELGYVLVAEDWAGVDNPKWNGDPVPLRVMLREPKPRDLVDVAEKGLVTY
ncbi:hypothetical protein L226DRAFT_535520 [Lentinus tigrinus ALCF2SS1-7]|uniref:N-acetyltransferase domain-containing protein n=1 Tax=Lentinus tigrinus ALCF2SS1-6 TaxID=1328759 RepID=A0A5C2SEI0_9APHY|nr:hypothetical protein L227DRAFT_574010 [Lentinus tigrinus ALCF2SS1-6]RPD74651.1 hypothetical protein L226DRAFT_535520 [Lentinus tigrinus ALCF2SS1-7]